MRIMKMFDRFLNFFKGESNSNEDRYYLTISIDKDSYKLLNKISADRGFNIEKEAVLFLKTGVFFEITNRYWRIKISFKDSNGKEKTVGYEELIQYLLNSK